MAHQANELSPTRCFPPSCKRAPIIGVAQLADVIPCLGRDDFCQEHRCLLLVVSKTPLVPPVIDQTRWQGQSLLNIRLLRNTQKMQGFTAREASRLAGFEKPWTLNHLEREEIFVPDQKRARQQGKHRSYTFRDVVVLRAINRMLKLGARPRRIRDSIETFLSMCPPAEGEDALLKFARTSSFFVITDKAVLFCASPGALTDLAKKGQLAFSFMVDNKSAIGPAVEAGLFYLAEIQRGRKRGEKLLELAASRFGL